jgi:hypothetical protein
MNANTIVRNSILTYLFLVNDRLNITEMLLITLVNDLQAKTY